MVFLSFFFKITGLGFNKVPGVYSKKSWMYLLSIFSYGKELDWIELYYVKFDFKNAFFNIELHTVQTIRHEKNPCFVFVSCPCTQTRTRTRKTLKFSCLDTKHEHEKHEIFVFRHENFSCSKIKFSCLDTKIKEKNTIRHEWTRYKHEIFLYKNIQTSISFALFRYISAKIQFFFHFWIKFIIIEDNLMTFDEKFSAKI